MFSTTIWGCQVCRTKQFFSLSEGLAVLDSSVLPHQYLPLLQVLSIQPHSGAAFVKARSWYLRGLPWFPQTRQTRDSLRLPATCLHGPLET